MKVLHTSLLSMTVVVFKALPLGSYAPVSATSPPFKTILELVLFNGLQSCRRIKLGKSGSDIRETLVQVYGDNANEKTAVYTSMTRFSEVRGSVTDEERSGRQATSRTEENITKFVKLCVKIVG
jgi:hypothetical protein